MACTASRWRYRGKQTSPIIIAEITFHKLANEAERKYPEDTLDIRAVLASTNNNFFHELVNLARSLPHTSRSTYPSILLYIYVVVLFFSSFYGTIRKSLIQHAQFGGGPRESITTRNGVAAFSRPSNVFGWVEGKPCAVRLVARSL